MRKCPARYTLIISISTKLKIYRYWHSSCHYSINTRTTINMVQLFHQSILKICKTRSTQPIFINTVQQTDRNFSTEKIETFYLVYCSLSMDPMSCYISYTYGLGTRRELGNIQPQCYFCQLVLYPEAFVCHNRVPWM